MSESESQRTVGGPTFSNEWPVVGITKDHAHLIPQPSAQHLCQLFPLQGSGGGFGLNKKRYGPSSARGGSVVLMFYTWTGTQQRTRHGWMAWYHVPVLLSLMRTYVGHAKVRVSPRFFPLLPQSLSPSLLPEVS